MKNALVNAFNEIIENLDYPRTNVIIQLPKHSEHGDFSTNIAMVLSGKIDDTPTNIANTLISKLILKNWIWIESKIDPNLQANQYRVYSKSRKKDVTNEV